MGREDINGVYIGKNNYLLEVFDKINSEITSRNIDLINDFSENKSISLMIVPTSLEILENYSPLFSPKINQQKYIEFIEENLHENINFVNLVEILKSKNHEYIYYKTDHHYTTLGAYYTYLEFMKSLNLDGIPIEDFEIQKVSDNFLGSLFSKVNFKRSNRDSVYIFNLKNPPDITVDYGNKISNSFYEFSHLKNPRDHYNIFLDNNHPIIKINSSINNGKKLGIIKDSFANSLIPFLTNHFEEIHVIDLRFYNSNINSYIEENNLKDILFLYNAKNFSEENNLIFIRKERK